MRSPWKPKRLQKFILILFSVCLILFLIGSLARHHSINVANRPSSHGNQASKSVINKTTFLVTDPVFRKPVTFDNPARTIEVGLHVENIHGLSLADQTFWVEGWYWLIWPEAIQKIIDQNKIDLKNMVELTNQVEDDSMVIEPEPGQPLQLPGNFTYQLFRVSGKFYADKLTLEKSPFQKIVLPVTIETRPLVLSCTKGGPPCVHLKPQIYQDKTESLMGLYSRLNGYEYQGAQVVSYIHKYNSNFGVGEPVDFPSVDFSFIYKANPIAAFSQYLLPLLVIIGVVLASPSLPGSIGDVRLAIPSTALLTLIFLEQSYLTTIPSLSYLTFLSWLYVYAYILAIIFFILYCWGTHQYITASEEKKRDTEKRIDRIDIYFQIGGIVALLVAFPLAWHLSG